MTIDEAITQLKMDRDLCNFNPMTGEEEPMNEDCRKTAEALDMAIKALEQEPCEDAVSRKAIERMHRNNIPIKRITPPGLSNTFSVQEISDIEMWMDL